VIKLPKWYKEGSPTLWLRSRNKLEELLNLLTFGRWPRVIKPEIVGIIDARTAYLVLKVAFPRIQRILLSDERYQITTMKSIKDFLSLDDTDKAKYVPVWYDCDDFSFRLMGQFHRGNWACLAVGIAWSKVHAYNIVILPREFAQYTVYIIEPQTDELLMAADVKDAAYDTVFVIM